MRVNTDLPADSVEFCPAPASQHIFVCGTYQLEEEHSASEVPVTALRPRRWGQCLLYEVDESSDECVRLQAITMPAVLDMKWNSTLLAIVDAESNVMLQVLREEDRRLDHVQTLNCTPDDSKTLCLSLDWAKTLAGTHADKMSVSLSNGMALVAKQSSTGLIITDAWKSHEFEPWITAWDRWDLNVVYTGGDDCKLKGWDIREGFSQPLFSNQRFDAGVTSIQSNPHIERMVAVGSYDGTVRLYDMRRPLQTINEANVGGGAWRVKWHPAESRRHHLLVACMHAGFKVVDFEWPSSDDTRPERWRMLTQFDKHESLAYGADWAHAPSKKQGSLVASCSFYDHSLYLWRA